MKEEKTNILLVDDHPENLLALEALLGDLGQNLVRAVSGREALRLVLQQDFAVILLDVEMPLLDGFETAELIRNREKSRHTPIIFLTAHNRTDEHIFKGYSLGAVDYLTKPFLPAILRSKVMVFVELHKQREETKLQAALISEANRFISAVLDNAGSIVIVLDNNGCIVQSNRAFEKILGFTAAETNGRKLSDFLEPRDPLLSENETTCIAKDGSRKIIVWTETPIAEGERGSAVLTGNDVTERKRAEQERERFIRTESARLQAEEAQRRAAFLANAGAKLASTLDYEETLKNTAKLPITSLADWCFVTIRSEGEGEPRHFISHKAPEKECVIRGLKCFNGGGDSSFLRTGEVIQSGRSVLLAEVSSGNTPGEDSGALAQIGCGSAIVVPLTKRHATIGVLVWVSETPGRYGPAELSLAESLSRHVTLTLENVELFRGAQQANQAKDEFLATLSHEIRTPMNAILGWMHVLKKKRVDEVTMTRAMEAIHRNAKAQADLIEDMLDVSRIITGRLSIDCRAMELAAAIDAALDAVRPAAEARNVTLDCRIETEDTQWWGDASRIQQIVWNLLSNAVKFTPPGGKVSVKLQRTVASLVLTVTDTGNGIAPDFLPFVFERFRQAVGAMNRKYGGLGLGLSIARHLVELHGGVIEASSEGEGKGATFTVCFPLRAGSSNELTAAG